MIKKSIIHFFIKLNLHTKNIYTLDKTADIISNTFTKLILDNEKYKWFPLGLEKLCNLLNKIIIICSDNYTDSKLKNIVIPLNKLYDEYHFSELGKYNITKSDYHKAKYNQLLSTKQQEKSLEVFETLFPNIDKIVEMNQEDMQDNSLESDILEGDAEDNEDIENMYTSNYVVGLNNKNDNIKKIIESDDILNKLSSFNKIGLSLVKPHNDDDVISKNFDFRIT